MRPVSFSLSVDHRFATLSFSISAWAEWLSLDSKFSDYTT